MRIAALTVCLALTAATPALAADPVQGDWVTQAGNARVRIGPCPEDTKLMCGIVAATRGAAASARDVKNRDPALRARPILGMQAMTGFRRAAPGRWTGGRIYSAGNGQTYDGALTVRPDGTMKVEICLLKMACREQTWRRPAP